MDQAIENGSITQEEAEDLEQTNLILMGRTPDQNDVYVLAEDANRGRTTPGRD